MKKFSKVLVISILAILLFCVSLFSPLAAVNGKEAKLGDTVEYTLSIENSEQAISGIHLELFFDQNALKIKEVNVDNLTESTVVNDNQNADGTIKIVNGLINGSQGLACSEKTDLVKVTFEVIGEGDSEIKYYIPYMYDYDIVNIYQYTLTQTVTVNGKVAIENVPPVLAEDSDMEKMENFDKGDFENNVQGTGSGIKVVPTTKQTVATEPEKSPAINSTVIIACVCIAVIIGAVVVLVVVKSTQTKKNS